MKLVFISLVIWLCSCATIYAQKCGSGKLDPRVADVLKAGLGDFLSTYTTSVEKIRDLKFETPDFPSSDVKYLKVTADSIPVQVYNPAHATGMTIIISYHPGGFVTPILPSMKYDFWRQAKNYQAIVFAVDYRVAPENKYPAAVNDAYNAFKWIADHAQDYGGDTSRIVLSGASAGGNLAAVVCQKAKKEGIAHKIKLQVLNCPSTDNPKNYANYPSYQQNASGYFLSKKFCLYYISVYAPDEELNNPEVAPVQSKDLSGLPPVVMIAAEFDPLHDEDLAYAERLKKAGVRVWYKCFPGQIHCLLGLPPDAEELKELDRLIMTSINQLPASKIK
ncbi:alpha/beta hydrolase [Danxiaibacter flavus]|uniref:Alpha/beta hydrolase n=1 Tax=Danxiaibacter flavus TaxID=3049108 RepID=A0ABV3ZJQ9_9BACT|nr:alpha/beta hydrolase [Chitinophagaceae bacterium DXS]